MGFENFFKPFTDSADLREGGSFSSRGTRPWRENHPWISGRSGVWNGDLQIRWSEGPRCCQHNNTIIFKLCSTVRGCYQESGFLSLHDNLQNEHLQMHEMRRLLYTPHPPTAAHCTILSMIICLGPKCSTTQEMFGTWVYWESSGMTQDRTTQKVTLEQRHNTGESGRGKEHSQRYWQGGGGRHHHGGRMFQARRVINWAEVQRSSRRADS